MARAKRKVNTFSILIIFLLTIGVFVSTTLYFDMRHKNELLLIEVERLESSQILLMVPDEQAEVVAKWMAEHPKATQALLSHAKPQQEVKVTIGPGLDASPPSAHKTDLDESNTAAETGQDDIVVPSSLARTSDEGEKQLSAETGQTDIDIDDTQKNDLGLSTDPDAKQVTEQLANTSQKELVEVPLTISENEDGVKVISLPHGGIRVTTREHN